MPAADSNASSGFAAHDELKRRFGYDRGIVRTFTVFDGRPVLEGEHLIIEESVLEVGEPRTAAVGTGRDWRIDVTTRSPDGELLRVERWDMFGYSSGSPRAERARTATDGERSASTDVPVLLESFTLTPELVRARAAANDVWVAVHHDTAAAVAAGARDIFLDTISQITMFRERAGALVDDEHRLVSVALTMRSPICAGDQVELVLDDSDASDDDAPDTPTSDPAGFIRRTISLSARVGDRVHSRAEVLVVRTGPAGDHPRSIGLESLLP